MWDYTGNGAPGGLANLFNVEGGLDFVASAFVDVYFLGWFNLLDVELFRANLFSFDYQAPYVQPVLATQSGSTLFLNSGPRAVERLYLDTFDGDETFLLSGRNGTVNVEFAEGWYQTYTGIDRVVSYLGAGDDMLDATLLDDVVIEVHGQAGNDTIKAGSAGGMLYGG